MKPGQRVAYRLHDGAAFEYGTVTSVNRAYVHVLFDGDKHTKACMKDDLMEEESMGEMILSIFVIILGMATLILGMAL